MSFVPRSAQDKTLLLVSFGCEVKQLLGETLAKLGSCTMLKKHSDVLRLEPSSPY